MIATISLMVLVAVLTLGLLAMALGARGASNTSRSRAVAAANARMSLKLALAQLQKDLGDDRRITADASLLAGSQNPAAVGVWNGWTPDLVSKSNNPSPTPVDYETPKGQSGFRRWLVSSLDPLAVRQIGWHIKPPQAGGNTARLFSQPTSGFDLNGDKIAFSTDQNRGAVAWAVTQENTKARINIGTDETKRVNPEDRLQTPSRPDLSLSEYLKQPTDNWPRRAATVTSLPQAALDPAYGATPQALVQAGKDYTTHSLSLLTDAVKGGLKVDLGTGFELSDADFSTNTWSDAVGRLRNPFRSGTSGSSYKGERPLYQPINENAQANVFMDFNPASVNHKFQVNGVPTFDMLRAYYRTYRHLYDGSSGPTAFERSYSHVSTPERVAGRPWGVQTQPAVAPVLDRVNILFSIMAYTDGTLGILMTPYVTIWNPHNVALETEGLVVYPWIDLAVFWSWNVSLATEGTKTWSSSLSRFVGEGWAGNSGENHGRSSRPYFYFHLTQNGDPVASGSRAISPPIHLEPGEVRVFCLAEPNTRRDLNTQGNAAARTWRMKAVQSASDITSTLRSGILLNMRKSIDHTADFTVALKDNDRVNAARVEFDRNTYYYIMNMADSYQIKNPNAELMVEARGSLPAERNLCFYGQIHAGPAFGKGRDEFLYPSYKYQEIVENPKVVGSLLTYHRVAESGSLPQADLMFTTNPRQPFVTQYLSGSKFQSGPHYESLLQGGSSLTGLAMETTPDGQRAFYGPSQSAATGRTNLAFFEIPRSPSLSLGSYQHCDITATAFGCPSQIGNSWPSPYLHAHSVSRSVNSAPGGEKITPSLAFYDASYLANEALFDGFYLSGAAPRFRTRGSGNASPAVWENDQISESKSVPEVLDAFFSNPVANPLLNPRMTPYLGGLPPSAIKQRMQGASRCVRLAAHLMVEGGFNINSTSEEAWIAVLASLRGVPPASKTKTAISRFRHILSGPPANMAENDPWSGFRTLSDNELKLLAKNLVAEIKLRGPFLSLGEFVNRRVASDQTFNLAGALQSAIDKSLLNKKFTYATFNTGAYPFPSNVTTPNTGTNTPGWLTQADVLQGLAPFITPRSDTFVVRTLGEARGPDGRPIATVRLEALVQRVPDWVDAADDASTGIDELKSATNKNFGRRFKVLSIRELSLDPSGNPI